MSKRRRSTLQPEIRQSGIGLMSEHRNDFRTCPHCGHSEDHQAWNRYAVVLALEPRFFKADSVEVTCECPQCFQRSWTHERMAMFGCDESWPQGWPDAVEQHERAMRLKALRDWGAALCHRCAKLTAGEVEYTTNRTCLVGFGPAECRCEHFVPVFPPSAGGNA